LHCLHNMQLGHGQSMHLEIDSSISPEKVAIAA